MGSLLFKEIHMKIIRKSQGIHGTNYSNNYIDFSPIRLCLKGFLLDPKVMGGLAREAATPGSLGMRPPWVPWASRLGSLGLQSLVPRPKSENPKNCFGAFDCQKIAFGVLSCQKIAFGVLNCRKCFGILSCHKIARAF